MVKFRAKTKDCQLVVKARLSSGDRLDEQQFDLFSRTCIRGFLKAQKGRWGVIEYTGPIGISLYERLLKPISKYDFLFIIEQFVDMRQKIFNNNLIVNRVIWDIHHIFINEVTKEMQFIYLPLDKEYDVIELMDVIKFIIYSARPFQAQDMEFMSRFAYYIQGMHMFDAEKIEQYISREDRNIVNIIKKHNTGQSGFMTDKQKDYYAHYSEKNNELDEPTGLLAEEAATGLLEEDEATGLLDEEEATGLLADDNETMLLTEDAAGMENGQQVHYPTMYRVMTGERITINKPVFRFGKERSYTDYFVSNNNAVSRSHADIITRGMRYFIIDLNSKNKTYVNGQAIPVQVETEIYDGCQIRLGNEEFTFYR